jgi:phosphoribosylanthranilate isomerase
MKIKICGNTNILTAEIFNEFLPDYIGFIFAENSRRKISIDKAQDFKQVLKSNIKTVGVFANQDISFLQNVIESKSIDLVQLHGDENNDYILELKKNNNNIEVIKAFKANQDLLYNIEDTKADYVLIDSENKNGFGGTGKVFDWNIIPKKCRNKLFLAGGLNIDNIDKAIKIVRPYCLDINSGVETNGEKDIEKIKQIIQRIKGYKNE